ncbi:hypothetical protein [Sinomonas sp. P47F7]|uniref:hypothetical protein n=1 Tax=Sinomonas sp. P47F7 TaxID=3410987 RepID=UPI003BF5C40C
MSQTIADGRTVDDECLPPQADRDWPIGSQVLAMIGKLLETPGLGEVDRGTLRSLLERYGAEHP